MEDKLDTLEQQVIKMLLEGDDPVLATLRTQAELAQRGPREMSGVGFFTHFAVPKGPPRLASNTPGATGWPPTATATPCQLKMAANPCFATPPPEESRVSRVQGLGES